MIGNKPLKTRRIVKGSLSARGIHQAVELVAKKDLDVDITDDNIKGYKIPEWEELDIEEYCKMKCSCSDYGSVSDNPYLSLSELMSEEEYKDIDEISIDYNDETEVVRFLDLESEKPWNEYVRWTKDNIDNADIYYYKIRIFEEGGSGKIHETEFVALVTHPHFIDAFPLSKNI